MLQQTIFFQPCAAEDAAYAMHIEPQSNILQAALNA